MKLLIYTSSNNFCPLSIIIILNNFGPTNLVSYFLVIIINDITCLLVRFIFLVEYVLLINHDQVSIEVEIDCIDQT